MQQPNQQLSHQFIQQKIATQLQQKTKIDYELQAAKLTVRNLELLRDDCEENIKALERARAVIGEFEQQISEVAVQQAHAETAMPDAPAQNVEKTEQPVAAGSSRRTPKPAKRRGRPPKGQQVYANVGANGLTPDQASEL